MRFIKGDKELEHVLSVKQKSLRVNLNEHIYGTFAEIGAGQETVRHFFRAGGAYGRYGAGQMVMPCDLSNGRSDLHQFW